MWNHSGLSDANYHMTGIKSARLGSVPLVSTSGKITTSHIIFTVKALNDQMIKFIVQPVGCLNLLEASEQVKTCT